MSRFLTHLKLKLFNNVALHFHEIKKHGRTAVNVVQVHFSAKYSEVVVKLMYQINHSHKPLTKQDLCDLAPPLNYKNGKLCS